MSTPVKKEVPSPQRRGYHPYARPVDNAESSFKEESLNTPLLSFSSGEVRISKPRKVSERTTVLPTAIDTAIDLTLNTQPFSSSLPPSSESPTRPRIPRPPNAFMLFRSDFLKKGIIPNHIERRQQHLSRLSADLWNNLDEGERQQWHDKAQQALAEHQQKNPDYKFSPSPRGSRRGKSGKLRTDVTESNEEHLQMLRNKYLKLPGPPAVSERKKRQQGKKTRKVEDTNDRDVLPHLPMLPLPGSGSTCEGQISSTNNNMPPTPKLVPAMAQFPFVPVPQRFGHSSMQQSKIKGPRRPSTSLGFVEEWRPMMSDPIPRPGSTVPTSLVQHASQFLINQFRNPSPAYYDVNPRTPSPTAISSTWPTPQTPQNRAYMVPANPTISGSPHQFTSPYISNNLEEAEVASLFTGVDTRIADPFHFSSSSSSTAIADANANANPQIFGHMFKPDGLGLSSLDPTASGFGYGSTSSFDANGVGMGSVTGNGNGSEGGYKPDVWSDGYNPGSELLGWNFDDGSTF